MKKIFVIEHLEPKLWPWCLIEYKNISRIVGKNNLLFTNIKKQNIKKLKNYGEVISKSVKNLSLDNACVLDPEVNKTLSPKEAKKFSYFIFGGILGDNPPRKRTKKELTKYIGNFEKPNKLKNAEIRNLGKEQLSTDSAVYVVKKIIKGKKLANIKFQDSIEIKINSIESVILPYRYPLINGKPNIPKELIKYLKKHPLV